MRIGWKTALAGLVFGGASLALGIPAPTASAGGGDADVKFWNSVKDSKNVELLRAYLATYPFGGFAHRARQRIHQLETGSSLDPDSARESANDPPSSKTMANLADDYRYGRGGKKKDLRLAYKWTRKAAEAGDVHSMYKMGDHYVYSLYELEGRRDWKKAVVWYKRAAQKGHVNAMVFTGHGYQHGLGVEKDAAKALEWYRNSAEAGNSNAMARIANVYSQGDGIPKDLVRAYRWYKRAAEAGDAVSWFALGNMHDGGNGVPKDPEKAAAFFYTGFQEVAPHNFEHFAKSASVYWSSQTRKALQGRLIQAGLYDGKADGNFGRGTIRALGMLPELAKQKIATEPLKTPSEVLQGFGDINELEKLD